MRTFLAQLIRMVLMIASCALLIEAILFLQMQNKRAHVLEDWPDMADLEADILLIGNSRTAEHAIPSFIEDGTGLRAYNIGYDGYSIQMGVHRLDYFLKHAATPPQMVILQMDLSFCEGDGKFSNFPMKNGVLRYFFLDQIGINDYFREYENWRDADEYVPLLRYKGYPSMFFKHLIGWNRWDRREKQGFWHLYNTIPQTFELPHPPANSSITLFGMDTICKKHGIELVCIIPPSLASSSQPSESSLFELSEEHPVWDFSQLFNATEETVFMDKAHLNYVGAIEYSKAINLKLLEHLQQQ